MQATGSGNLAFELVMEYCNRKTGIEIFKLIAKPAMYTLSKAIEILFCGHHNISLNLKTVGAMASVVCCLR